MKTAKLSLTLMILTMMTAVGVAAEPPQSSAPAETKGEKPASSPGWMIVEEDFWAPLRFEPLRALDGARFHYRQREESAAANEVDKAASWLRLAEGTASPADKEKLAATAKTLSSLAVDLRTGDIAAAEKLDSELGKAAAALASWHSQRAKDALAESEEEDAGQDLELAAAYLQHAANSAHFEFGPDVQEVITRTYKHGKLVSESATVRHDNLGKDLQQIEKALYDLGEKMVKAAKVAKS